MLEECKNTYTLHERKLLTVNYCDPFLGTTKQIFPALSCPKVQYATAYIENIARLHDKTRSPTQGQSRKVTAKNRKNGVEGHNRADRFKI